MRCWWQSNVYAPLGEVQSPCRSHFGTRFHPSSTDANVPFIWWVKRFLIGKRGCHTFFPQNGHLKKMTNKPFAAQWDVFNRVYQHTSNSHPWSLPLKCVLKYEKHRLRRRVDPSNTYRASHDKVSSFFFLAAEIGYFEKKWWAGLNIFLVISDFFLKRPGQNWFKLSSYY